MASVAPLATDAAGSNAFNPALLTRWPLLGHLLRSGYLMTGLRLISLALLVAAIATGLFTANAKAGLTLLLTWGFFWPMLTPVLTPTLGNAYCAVCPLGFLGKRLNRIGLRRSFPRQLRGVWIGLLVLVLGYWAIVFPMPTLLGTSTRATAIYFLVFSVTALVTFAVFRDMAWCKHVCPLGRVLATHGKVGTLKITTDARACGECRTFECAKACSYHLSPFRFEKQNNMDACTLCTDCVTACDNVHLAARPPGQALTRSISGVDRHEAWVFLTILAIVGVAIQFDHSIGRTGLADHLPWNLAGARLNRLMAVDPKVFDLGKMLLLLASVASTFALGAWAYQRAAKLAGRSWQETANTLAVALAPLAVMALIPHAVTMFATVNASALANEAGAWLGAAWKVAPLATRKDTWVIWLTVLPWIGMLWSLRLVWARAGLLAASGRQRLMVWFYGSLPAWLFIGVMLTSIVAKLLMPAPGVHHH